MTETETTPTPWELVKSDQHHGPYIIDAVGGDIADLYCMSKPDMLSTRNGGESRPVHFQGERADANAALIVRAVNSHAALVEALRGLEVFFSRDGENSLETFERVADVFHRATGILRPGKDSWQHDPEEQQAAWDKWVAARLADARAALRAAEKERG